MLILRLNNVLSFFSFYHANSYGNLLMIIWVSFHKCWAFFIQVFRPYINHKQTTILLLFLNQLQRTENSSGNVRIRHILEEYEKAETEREEGTNSCYRNHLCMTLQLMEPLPQTTTTNPLDFKLS